MKGDRMNKTMIERLKELVEELLGRGVKSTYRYRVLYLEDDIWDIAYFNNLKRFQFGLKGTNLDYWDVFLDMEIPSDKDLHSTLLLHTNKIIEADINEEDVDRYIKALNKTMEER